MLTVFYAALLSFWIAFTSFPDFLFAIEGLVCAILSDFYVVSSSHDCPSLSLSLFMPQSSNVRIANQLNAIQTSNLLIVFLVGCIIGCLATLFFATHLSMLAVRPFPLSPRSSHPILYVRC